MAKFQLTPTGEADENGIVPYEITVTFHAEGDPTFTQQVISSKTGDELEAQMQEYADQYETDWKASNNMV